MRSVLVVDADSLSDDGFAAFFSRLVAILDVFLLLLQYYIIRYNIQSALTQTLTLAFL